MGISQYAFNISTASKSGYYTALNYWFVFDPDFSLDVSVAKINKQKMSIKYENNSLFFL